MSWYRRNRERILAKNKRLRETDPKWRRKVNACVRAANLKRREKIYAFIRALKNVPCLDCGRRYPHWVMDFDHVRGRKLFSIGKASYKTKAQVLKEAAKCEIVCSNCHRTRTYERRMEKFKRAA